VKPWRHSFFEELPEKFGGINLMLGAAIGFPCLLFIIWFICKFLSSLRDWLNAYLFNHPWGS
jgi:hypothetical protein